MSLKTNIVKINFGIVCVFPDIIDALKFGIIGKAIDNKHININTYDIKSFTSSRKDRIDDKPYGGGPGMIIRYEPLRDAILAAKEKLGNDSLVIYLSPQGRLFEQTMVNKLSSNYTNIILICGRYEGIDARIIENFVDIELSIGNYVLSGGEFAALVIIDSVSRQLDGVLGNKASAISDSLYDKLLEYPQYTRPAIIDNHKVPSTLLSGDHKSIDKWRTQKSLEITKDKRPELLQKNNLDT